MVEKCPGLGFGITSWLAFYFGQVQVWRVMTKYQNQDADFREWCERYPTRFYLTQKSPKKFVLHKADCHHAGSVSIGSSPTKHAKYCSANREELVQWGSSEGREIIKICGSCKL
jgi:hypothetical protein